MNTFLGILLGVLLYAILCLIIACVRVIFSKSGKRKYEFKKTFWSFFIETLNPFHWFW